MKTKAELRAWLEANDACEEARAWVDAQEGDADAILEVCGDVDWLCWVLARLDRASLVEFARECASRGGDAARYANAAHAADVTDRYAAVGDAYRYTAGAARHAANAARHAAWCANPYSAAERERQLTDLCSRIRAALGET